MKQFKWLSQALLPAVLMAILLQACENDLNKVKQLASMQKSKPVDTTKGADVIYSDSAKVKAHLLTPIILHHLDKIPYYEMPKGVKIVLYDSKLNQKQLNDNPDKHIVCTITSNYAITRNAESIVELRKNVIVTNPAGDTLRTEELIWDKLKKQIFSNQRSKLNKADGTLLDGESFTSNEDFTDSRFEKFKGDVITQGKLGQ